MTLEKFTEIPNEHPQIKADKMSQIKDMIIEQAAPMIIPVYKTMDEMIKDDCESIVMVLKSGGCCDFYLSYRVLCDIFV